ncbi:MAG: flagellum-specific ATP synthase FliI, partial [Pseudomonadota bacterium]|nr:flagellum-specific ATP synthase FliI [Pseudomonadota bacterium]
MLQTGRSEIWKQRLDPYLRRAEQAQPFVVTGKLTRMVGLTLEAVGCQASIGGRCLIELAHGEP